MAYLASPSPTDPSKSNAQALLDTAVDVFDLTSDMIGNLMLRNKKEASPNDPTSSDSSEKTPASPGKLQKEVEKGRAPKGVDRVDPSHTGKEEAHVHFKDITSSTVSGKTHDKRKVFQIRVMQLESGSRVGDGHLLLNKMEGFMNNLVICKNIQDVIDRNLDSIGWELIRFPSRKLGKTYFSESTCNVLENLGLPNWAAPHLHFGSFEKDEWLPSLGSWSWREEEAPDESKNLIVIGNQESPICIARDDSVILVEPSNCHSYINSNVFKLLQCLALFADLVDIILEKSSEFHKNNPTFLSTLCQEFKTKSCAIDPGIKIKSSFWAIEINRYEEECSLKYKI